MWISMMAKPVNKNLYHVAATYVSGQAVAAIRARKNFECIVIKHESHGPYRDRASRIEWGENGHPLSKYPVTPEIWEDAAESSDESECRDDLIRIALAGAFAVRRLVHRPRRADRYPSCTDVDPLVQVEHYEPRIFDLLKRIRRRPYAKDSEDNLTALDMMIDEDALFVEPFVDANAREISGVGKALLDRLTRGENSHVQARFEYDEVKSAIHENPSATEKVGRT
jgi:hypothetical protein